VGVPGAADSVEGVAANVEIRGLEASAHPSMRPVSVTATPSCGADPRIRTRFFDTREPAPETTEQPSQPPICGARTRAGAPCDRAPEPGRRRCRLHGGAPGTGAPPANTNARKHGRYSGKSRELRALGRLQNRTADLARAQLAVMKSCARGDGRGVEIAEQRVSKCMQRLLKAALALDRVLVERGDEVGRRGLVEGARRLSVRVRASADDTDVDSGGSGRSVRLRRAPARESHGCTSRSPGCQVWLNQGSSGP